MYCICHYFTLHLDLKIIRVSFDVVKSKQLPITGSIRNAADRYKSTLCLSGERSLPLGLLE